MRYCVPKGGGLTPANKGELGRIIELVPSGQSLRSSMPRFQLGIHRPLVCKRRGGIPRANGIEDLIRRLLDVFQALQQ